MRSLEQRVSDVIQAAQALGLNATSGQVLSDGGNLIVRLMPCDCVARVMTLFGDEDSNYWRNVFSREVSIARHLHEQGVSVVTPVAETPHT